MSKQNFTNQIEAIMAEKGVPTLKAIAAVFDLPPVRIYTVAKTPKEGEVYDAKVFNWDAIEKFVSRRLGQENTPATLEEFVDAALVKDTELKEMDGRRAANRGISSVKQIEVDGKMIAARRYTNHEMYNSDGTETGNLVVLKKDENVYKIVYQTLSHTVLVPVADMSGTVASQDVKVISNTMLNMKGLGPVMTQQLISERLAQ